MWVCVYTYIYVSLHGETFCFKIQKEMCIYKFIKITLFGLLSYYFS